MNAEIENGISDKGAPYVELKISLDDEDEDFYWITFRKYRRRVFVGVEDYRFDQSGGQDLEDCWSAPVFIIQKTMRELFDPHQAFMDALVYLGEINPSVALPPSGEKNFDLYFWEERYTEIESKVIEWQNT